MWVLNLIIFGLLSFVTYIRIIGSLGIVAIFLVAGLSDIPGNGSESTLLIFDNFYNVINDFDPLRMLKEENSTISWDRTYITKIFTRIGEFYIEIFESVLLKVPDFVAFLDNKLCKCNPGDETIQKIVLDVFNNLGFDIPCEPDEKVEKTDISDDDPIKEAKTPTEIPNLP